MSHIFNRSGAEDDLFRELSRRGISRFSSIADLLSFKNNYRNEIVFFREKTEADILVEIDHISEEIISLRSEYEQRHTERTELINSEIAQLNIRLQASFKSVISKIRRYSLRKRLSRLESHFEQIVNKPLRPLFTQIQNLSAELSYLSSHQHEETERRTASFIAETERIVSVLSELSPRIYGAIGELKAIELLKKLPDEYCVINNYQRSFHRPLHMKSENDWIYSIQLDHVVVGPTGVFVIETKYWSSKSIASNTFFSPIKQLRRGGFALFVVLNNGIRGYRAFNSHWGSAQVSVVNILLMMNATTNEQFQYVKILTESNLLSYITNRSVVFTNDQVRCLVERVL